AGGRVGGAARVGSYARGPPPPATIATTSAPAAVQTAQPFQCSETPNRPTVVAVMKAASVATPNPTDSSGGTQCRQASRSTAITSPATAFNRNAGPTLSLSWPQSKYIFKCTAPDTSTAAAANARILMVISVRPWPSDPEPPLDTVWRPPWFTRNRLWGRGHREATCPGVLADPHPERGPSAVAPLHRGGRGWPLRTAQQCARPALLGLAALDRSGARRPLHRRVPAAGG